MKRVYIVEISLDEWTSEEWRDDATRESVVVEGALQDLCHKIREDGCLASYPLVFEGKQVVGKARVAKRSKL